MAVLGLVLSDVAQGAGQACRAVSPGGVCDATKMTQGEWSALDVLDFARLYTMHQAGAFFVTRAKSNICAL